MEPVVFKVTVSSGTFLACRTGRVRRGGEDEAQADGDDPRREADHRHRQQRRAAPPPHGSRHQYAILGYVCVPNRVSDPYWIRIQPGQWIRIQEGKNDPQK